MGVDLLPEVRRLMSEGKGDRLIAEALNAGRRKSKWITRHQVRNLMREVERADLRQGTPAETEDFNETLRTDPQAWALRISRRWQASIDAIIQTGRLLLEAKEALPHGAFGDMIESDLPFGARTAQMLMAIATDKRLSNPKHVSHLPASWGTLHALTQLSDEEFDRGVQQQIIRPDMERKEVEILRPAPQRAKPGPDQREPGTLEMFGSDGGGESRPANPSGVVSGRTEPPVCADDDLQERNIPQAGVAPGPSEPDAGAHLREGSEPTADQEEDRSARPDPLPPAMPGGGLAIAHNRVEPSDSLDFFPTPPWATRALVERVFDHLGRRGHTDRQVCWEPACGEGHMAEPLAEYFKEVIASDIKDYGYAEQHVVDFLTVEQLNRQYDADWIITNPPFGDNTDKFILKALDLAGAGVAMLVRLQCLETLGRYVKIFKDTPPTLIAFFVERVPMHKGRWEPEGDTMTAYIWLVWIKGEEPRAPYWIPPGCRAALTKPDDAARFGAATTAEAAE